jgi:hypothetical protein
MASKPRRMRQEDFKSRLIAAMAWVAAMGAIVRWLFTELARKATRA